MPEPKDKSIKKTVIFDLDETLIHCVDDPEIHPPQALLEVKFSNEEIVDAGINIRPYALECLRELKKYY